LPKAVAKGSARKMLASLGLRLRQRQFLSQTVFEKELMKMGDCHQCRIVSVLKMYILKLSFQQSINHKAVNKPYRIKKYIF
jgi:hypothetical protein